MKAVPAPARLSEARFTRMAKLDPLEHAYWVGWDVSKLQKRALHIHAHLSTILHHPYTFLSHSYASLDIPTQTCNRRRRRATHYANWTYKLA
jgi:hypothetical protein